MKYYIGIDGGGSHSRLVAIDGNKQVIGRYTGGSTNINSETYQGVYENLKRLLGALEKDFPLSHCAALCIGSAGANIGDNAVLLEQIFRELGIVGQVKVINDGELVLIASANQGGEAKTPCMVIISGTGSIGYGMDCNGIIHRAGGWGHIVDDGGSGYRIGLDALKAVLMGMDGRCAQTSLTDMVLDFFQANGLGDILTYVYSDRFKKSEVAKLSLLVSAAVAQGDHIAKEIEIQAAQDLFLIVQALMGKVSSAMDLERTCTIVFGGSVLLHNTHIRTMVENLIQTNYPKACIVPIAKDAELFAAEIAHGL